MKYNVISTKQYRRDYRKLKRSGHHDLAKLEAVIEMIACGEQLPAQNRDHALKGNLDRRRECHIAPNWLLVYHKCDDALVLLLIRTGSHEDVFS